MLIDGLSSAAAGEIMWCRVVRRRRFTNWARNDIGLFERLGFELWIFSRIIEILLYRFVYARRPLTIELASVIANLEFWAFTSKKTHALPSSASGTQEMNLAIASSEGVMM
jgi:hypothetical protein